MLLGSGELGKEFTFWYDFGLGEGGSNIDLVMRLKRCDFAHAVRLLINRERVPIAAPRSLSPLSTVPALRILSDTPLRHSALLDYLRRRGRERSFATS